MNNITGFSVKCRSTGEKWLKFFFQHHLEVRVKHAHNLSVNRAMCANPATMQKFFKQYQDTLKELKIESPQQIWNCDETGCVDVPKERDVVGETGIEAVTIVRASPTGWINRNLFLEYATRWVRWLKSWKLLDCPHLLLLDVHKSHVYNLHFIQLMIEMDIHVLAIPSHTSHKVQPLDNAPFTNFKTAWNENLLQYLFQSVGCGMPKMDFFGLLGKSYDCGKHSGRFSPNRHIPLQPKCHQPSPPRPSQATDNLANLANEQHKKNWAHVMFHFFFTIKLLFSDKFY